MLSIHPSHIVGASRQNKVDHRRRMLHYTSVQGEEGTRLGGTARSWGVSSRARILRSAGPRFVGFGSVRFGAVRCGASRVGSSRVSRAAASRLDGFRVRPKLHFLFPAPALLKPPLPLDSPRASPDRGRKKRGGRAWGNGCVRQEQLSRR